MNNTLNSVSINLLNQIFDIAIAQWELDTDLGYDAITIADITKDIIETALKVSTD